MSAKTLPLGAAILLRLISRIDWDMDDKASEECYDALTEVGQVLERLGTMVVPDREEWTKIDDRVHAYVRLSLQHDMKNQR